MQVKLLSRVRLLATPWTAAHQAPPSMGFSRQEYWSGVPLPSPGVGAGGGIQEATRRPVKVTWKNNGRMLGDKLRESNKGDGGFQIKGKLTGHFSSYSH